MGTTPYLKEWVRSQNECPSWNVPKFYFMGWFLSPILNVLKIWVFTIISSFSKPLEEIMVLEFLWIQSHEKKKREGEQPHVHFFHALRQYTQHSFQRCSASVLFIVGKKEKKIVPIGLDFLLSWILNTKPINACIDRVEDSTYHPNPILSLGHGR